MTSPAIDYEYAFNTILRWMEENVLVAAGIYRSADGTLNVDPRLTVNEEGHIRHLGDSLRDPIPGIRQGQWMLSSATALIVCCYIAALGKVTAGGRVSRERGGDLATFEAFVREHMPELIDDSAKMEREGLFASLAPRGEYQPINAGTQALYQRFRCGFAHQFAHPDVFWARSRNSTSHWFRSDDGQLGLNVDRLVVSFINGVESLKVKWESNVHSGTATYKEFVDRLMYR